ncbi:MAG: ornithine cyclodeaminase family protein, partial [Phycisphaerae bacterium]|nr:ornithine cyclodeaminase family protein [Phycisphaerae bacterium]
MLILNACDVERALPVADAIAALRRAFAEVAAGDYQMPPRTHLPIPPHGDTTLIMPALLGRGAGQSLSVKVVSLFGGNLDRGLARIQAAVLVLDTTTGRPLAVLEGATLTAIRTAAASALATDLLARTGSRRLAIFGAGVQAAWHVRAICEVRKLESVRIYAPSPERRDRLAADLAGRGPVPEDVRAAKSAAEALESADIVCSVTTSSVPVFDDQDLGEGAHVNAVGSYQPTVCEIPAETVRRALVVVDEREAAWAEAGDLIQALEAGVIDRDHVQADLAELVTGVHAGR